MPIYVYKNTETKEVREVFLSYEERDSYTGSEGDSGEWIRVPHRVNFQVDSSRTIDPWEKKGFLEATAKKKGTFGDLLDLSAELSEKRKDQNGGVDPVKEQRKKEYKQKTGKDMIDPNESVKVSKNGVSIDFSDGD